MQISPLIVQSRFNRMSEVELRSIYFNQLYTTLPGGDQHPLVQLLKKCLDDDPKKRPSAEDVVISLQGKM